MPKHAVVQPQPEAAPAAKGPAPPPAPETLPSASGDDLLAIVRTLPDVVFRCVKDERGRIVWTLNEGRLAEEIHVTTKDVRGKTLHEMFPPEVADRQLPFFEAAFRGEAVEWTNEMGGRSFKHHPQPVRDASGKVVAVVGFITDVTGLVEAQKRAESLNLELMRRMEEVRQSNRRLEQANRDLELFASSVSHDLAQPLSVIGSTAHALQVRLGARLDDAGRDSLARVSASVARMGALMQDLLRFSRAAQQPLRIEDVDLGDLAWQAARALQAQEPARRVAWEIPPHLKSRADPGLLRVVLDNLLGNAWKYTGRRPEAHVRVSAEPGGVVAVADDGVGFDQATAGRLFEAFERLPSSAGFPGSGIGLATVRRIVERHGGRVWAEGRPGEGAVVRFTLAPPAGVAAA
jgi:signal transduction histidine kinase